MTNMLFLVFAPADIPSDQLNSAMINVIVINAIVGFLLPFLVQIVAKWNAYRWVKTLINLFLSAAAGVLNPLLGVDTINWKIVVISIGQVFIISVATHYGLYKPAGVTGSKGKLAQAVSGGLGPSTPAKSADVGSQPKHTAE